jgi:hypothetical protein
LQVEVVVVTLKGCELRKLKMPPTMIFNSREPAHRPAKVDWVGRGVGLELGYGPHGNVLQRVALFCLLVGDPVQIKARRIEVQAAARLKVVVERG